MDLDKMQNSFSDMQPYIQREHITNKHDNNKTANIHFAFHYRQEYSALAEPHMHSTFAVVWKLGDHIKYQSTVTRSDDNLVDDARWLTRDHFRCATQHMEIRL